MGIMYYTYLYEKIKLCKKKTVHFIQEPHMVLNILSRDMLFLAYIEKYFVCVYNIIMQIISNVHVENVRLSETKK